MSRFKTWFETQLDNNQEKIKLAWERALDALTGMEDADQAVTRSLGNLGGPRSVLKSLSEKGVFQALQNAGMSSAIERVKDWLTTQPQGEDGKSSPGGRQVGDLLKVMFGEDVFRQLQGGDEPEKPAVDQATAQVPPQPPVDSTPPQPQQVPPQQGQDFPPTPEQPIDPGMPKPANAMAAGGLRPPALQAAHALHGGKSLYQEWMKRKKK